MSILYASIIKTKGTFKIAESANYNKYKMQIKNIFPEIISGINIDRFELVDYFLSYIKNTGVIFICISDKRLGGEKPSKFLEFMISKVVGLYGTISNMVEKCDKELGLSTEININGMIDEFTTGIEESIKLIDNINKDVEVVKKEVNNNIKQVISNINNLDEALLKADNIKINADVFKKNTKKLEEESRPCCTPLLKTVSYIFMVLLILFSTYAVASLIRCGSLNIACEHETQ